MTELVEFIRKFVREALRVLVEGTCVCLEEPQISLEICGGSLDLSLAARVRRERI